MSIKNSFHSDKLLDILMLSNAATAIYSDEHLTISFANNAMLRLWGKDNRVEGMRLEEAVQELGGQSFIGILKEVWRSGKTYEVRDTPANLNVDGKLQTFHFDFFCKALHDETGKTYAILHTATEVNERTAIWKLVDGKRKTEQKINEELAAVKKELASSLESLEIVQKALTNHEHRLNQLIFTSHIGMTILDGHDLIINTANDYMLSIWMRTREKVIGKKLTEVFPELIGQPFPRMLRDVFDTGKSIASKEIAVEIISVDGTPNYIYVDFAYEPLTDIDGIVSSVLVTVTDITEIVETRKLLEESGKLMQNLNEELAASNEEYMAINDELNALNEEYVAINEELSASNEQLDYVSKELEKANILLSAANKGLKLENATLLASETKALALFADAPVAIGLLAGRGLIVESANVQILQLWGKSANIIGLKLEDALPELQGQPFLDILDKVYTSGVDFYGNESKVSINYAGQLIDKFFNFVYKPVKDDAGQVVYIMVVATDVTSQVEARDEIKEINSRLNLALEAGELGSYELNVNTGQMTCSEQCMKNFGMTAKDRFNFPDLLAAIAPEYHKHVEERVNVALKNNKIYVAEYPIIWPNGSKHWILASGRPRYDAEGRPIKMVGVTQNITERKNFDQRRDDFLSIASHELKTPITSLKANLQLLDRIKDKTDSPIVPKLIEASNRGIQKISSLVDDLLNINRFSEGKLHLQKSWFIVWEMLNVCCNYVRVEQKYELVIQGDRHVQIFADEHRIDQVVVNFVNNAIKYAPDSKTIYLIIDRTDQGVKISVKDMGAGIPQEQLPHLFDRYWRANDSEKSYSGLGLGLYICAEIIGRHGGKIGVDSTLGKGSTFWFTIPD